MSKVFRNIAFFSLWLAGLVIIAHLMIPHDHHSDCSVYDNDKECHSDNNHHSTKLPGFPLHCHAFNDLIFDKATPINVVYNNIPACDLFILSFFDPAIFAPVLSNRDTKDFDDPLIEIDFLRLSPFRAPPSLV